MYDIQTSMWQYHTMQGPACDSVLKDISGPNVRGAGIEPPTFEGLIEDHVTASVEFVGTGCTLSRSHQIEMATCSLQVCPSLPRSTSSAERANRS